MARLGVGEITAIEEKVRRMAGNLATGRSALAYVSEERKLLGAGLSVDPSGFTDVDLDVPSIRALYSPRDRRITLTGKTWDTGQMPDGATMDTFRTWVTAALAHEVCHLLQHRQSPARFEPGGEAEEAAALSRKAKCSGLAEDYVAYVECELELEAHATQLAAELRSCGGLSQDEFEQAFRGSSLVAHIKRKSTLVNGDLWPNWDDLEAKLIAEAWIASEMMWGR